MNAPAQFMSTQFSPGRTLFGHKSTLSTKKATIATTEPLRASVELQPIQQRVMIDKNTYNYRNFEGGKMSNLAVL